MDGITSEAGGSMEKRDPWLPKATRNVMSWTPVDFLNYFMPWEYFSKHVIPATNKALTDNGIQQELKLGELKQWLKILFLMSLHPQFLTDEFFCTNANTKGSKKRKCNDFWDPPHCGKYMSGKALVIYFLSFGCTTTPLQHTVTGPGRYAHSLMLLTST